MKQIRSMIARRRPVSQPAPTQNNTGPEVPRPGSVEPAQKHPEPGLGLIGDLDTGEIERAVEQDKDLVAARIARDAVPRFSERPRSLNDGRPTTMMSESINDTPTDTPRRKIWDIDDSDGSDDPATDAALANVLARTMPGDPTPVPAAAPATRRIDREPPDVPVASAAALAAAAVTAAPSDGRVKTRLLGFHADDLAQDIFEAPVAPAASNETHYPIGWLVVIDGPGHGASYALTAGLSTIGRGTDQTVTLDFGDGSISRDNHASIAFDEEENAAFIGHGGKSNIVRLNGKPLLSTEELQDADLIRIGKTTLRFVALCGPDFRWEDEGCEGPIDADDE